jgi:hypothetical protein
MRLLGKYAFERMRDAFQGIFECMETNGIWIMELWQIRFVIVPNQYVEIFLNQGENKPYKSFGKILLS